jgi:2Fe-2S ferredoxin
MRISVAPSGEEFEAAQGDTIMAAALTAGLCWPSVCGGLAECGVCIVEILEGEKMLGPVEERERARLDLAPQPRMRPDAAWRLACQAKGAGDGLLLLRKTGVRAARP